MQHDQKPIYGVLFHPEVAHTPRGGEILHNFLFDICGCIPDWTPGHFIDHEVGRIREMVGSTGRAICGLSGGVDSAVAAALVHRAIGERLTCVFVDHGLLRRGEREQVERTFRAHLGMDLRVVDATHRFLKELKDIEDPEEKRRRIGHTFIDVFEDAARHIAGEVGFLVQGTLYPDVIESSSPKGGPSATIKTHHNVGGVRANMPWKLIEPMRELFKDEVRQVGRELGMPDEIVGRHPFPGPGLARRVLGPVNEEGLCLARPGERAIRCGHHRVGVNGPEHVGTSARLAIRPWQAALLAGVLATLVAAPSIRNEFVADDQWVVANRQVLEHPPSAGAVFKEPYWPASFGGVMWRPAVISSFAVDYQVSTSPHWFHASNVVWAAIATALFALLACQLAGPVVGLITGLLFAVHPVHVEAVANVVGRAELMAAAGYAVALVCAGRAERDAKYLIGVVLGAALAITAKEIAVTLPAAVLLVYVGRGSGLRPAWRPALAAAAT